MFVTDLRHLLDLPEDAPGSARGLADHLTKIVRAATAGDAGRSWETALPCRRPANRRCQGRMIVHRTHPGTPIQWRCGACDDEGSISNWENSAFDRRRRQLAVVGASNEIILLDEVAAALRELRLVDRDCERLVFSIRAHPGGAVLIASDEDLDELIGFVAAEANHEPNRSRLRRLDAAFNALNTANHTPEPR